jgi:hypothetical protein
MTARTPKLVKTSFHLSPTLLRAAKTRAVKEGTSLRVLLVRAVQAYLGQPRKEGRE